MAASLAREKGLIDGISALTAVVEAGSFRARREDLGMTQPLMAGLEEAADDAAGASATPRGPLRVAVNALVARTLIGPRINDFLSENPELTLDLAVRERVGDLVGNGFDAAVLFGELEPSALIARKLIETRVVTCASRAYLAAHGTPSQTVIVDGGATLI